MNTMSPVVCARCGGPIVAVDSYEFNGKIWVHSKIDPVHYDAHHAVPQADSPKLIGPTQERIN